MEYRENPALVLQVFEHRAGEAEAPAIRTRVWPNIGGGGIASFDLVTESEIETARRMIDTEGPTEQSLKIEVRTYAVKIPSWVREGCEQAFLEDVYGLGRRSDRFTSDHRDEDYPLFRYTFEATGVVR